MLPSDLARHDVRQPGRGSPPRASTPSSTACPTTGTSCTSAVSPAAAPGWSSAEPAAVTPEGRMRLSPALYGDLPRRAGHGVRAPRPRSNMPGGGGGRRFAHLGLEGVVVRVVSGARLSRAGHRARPLADALPQRAMWACTWCWRVAVGVLGACCSSRCWRGCVRRARRVWCCRAAVRRARWSVTCVPPRARRDAVCWWVGSSSPSWCRWPGSRRWCRQAPRTGPS